MAYEFMVYREMAKSMPHTGEKVKTPDGIGRVLEMNILKQYVVVDLGEGKITKLFYGKEKENDQVLHNDPHLLRQ